MKTNCNSKRILYFLILFLPLLSIASPSDWQKIKRPITGEPIPVGTYNNGCLIGAKPLPFNGEGYQVIRTNKNRYYGHPDMISYLQDLGKKIKARGMLDMLVGDIAMPGGGRFLTGHASHQMGLDADIWFRMGKLSAVDAQDPSGMGLLVVDRKAHKVINHLWTKDHEALLKLASQDSRVARIFVNPAIKVKLCETVKGDRSWLRKLRPWFGHDSHFHVRLNCPKDATFCVNQSPIPKGEGCGSELYSWFEPRKPASIKPKKKIIPEVPILCQQILTAPNRSEWID